VNPTAQASAKHGRHVRAPARPCRASVGESRGHFTHPWRRSSRNTTEPAPPGIRLLHDRDDSISTPRNRDATESSWPWRSCSQPAPSHSRTRAQRPAIGHLGEVRAAIERGNAGGRLAGRYGRVAALFSPGRGQLMSSGKIRRAWLRSRRAALLMVQMDPGQGRRHDPTFGGDGGLERRLCYDFTQKGWPTYSGPHAMWRRQAMALGGW
jgi:hypothetical protein